MKRSLLLCILAVLLATGCSPAPGADAKAEAERLKAENQALKKTVEQLKALGEPAGRDSLTACAGAVVSLLKSKDYEQLSKYVDPENGVRFSPYAFVDLQKDKVFTAEQIKNIASDTAIYPWGSYDGSGEPIELTFSQYAGRFIYDKPFIQPDKLGYNEAVGSGNTTDNLKEAYPQARFVEFYCAGTEANGEMDWAGLRLVFQQKDGLWYLVGVIHTQWTV